MPEPEIEQQPSISEIIEQLRSQVRELQSQQVADQRAFESRVIEHATALLKERDERQAHVAAENARVEAARKFRHRPETYDQWNSLTTGEKSECISIFGEGVVSDCLADKRRKDARIREEQQLRKLADAVPLFNRP